MNDDFDAGRQPRDFFAGPRQPRQVRQLCWAWGSAPSCGRDGQGDQPLTAAEGKPSPTPDFRPLGVPRASGPRVLASLFNVGSLVDGELAAPSSAPRSTTWPSEMGLRAIQAFGSAH